MAEQNSMPARIADPLVFLDRQQKDLAFLRVMLDAHPVIPEGFDGWWAFEKGVRKP